MSQPWRASAFTAEWREMEILKAAIRHMEPRLGYYSDARTELLRMAEHMSWELRTYVLAENLGDEEVVRTHRETAEFVGFATWWDHWKATYRGRWWMRWRKWPINYKISEQHVDGRVAVDMTRYWAYPKAEIAPPEFGEPVRWLTQKAVTQQWSSAENKRFRNEDQE